MCMNDKYPIIISERKADAHVRMCECEVYVYIYIVTYHVGVGVKYISSVCVFNQRIAAQVLVCDVN